MLVRHSLLISVFLFIAGDSAYAGNWHIGATSHCNDCHLQHSTEEGEELPGGPYSYLLVKSSVNELCLSCHDGSDPTAPDVSHPVEMYSGTLSGESAAGFFRDGGLYDSHNHTLGITMLTPLQSAAKSNSLTCASCHAVHGNSNYRNLLHDPGGVGDSLIIEEGKEVLTGRLPDIPPTVAGSIAAYERGNIGYRSGISEWCVGCHDILRMNESSAPPAHFNGHPDRVALNQFVGDQHADPQHWITGTGDGFDLTAGGIRRVPFESPLATGFAASLLPSSGDRVFCGSCHKAHGGNYASSFLWPFKEGGASFNSGCQQCHNK